MLYGLFVIYCWIHYCCCSEVVAQLITICTFERVTDYYWVIIVVRVICYLLLNTLFCCCSEVVAQLITICTFERVTDNCWVIIVVQVIYNILLNTHSLLWWSSCTVDNYLHIWEGYWLLLGNNCCTGYL